VQNELIEPLTEVIKKMFELNVGKAMAKIGAKLKEFTEKGTCTLDDRIRLVAAKPMPIKIIFSCESVTFFDKHTKTPAEYPWNTIKSCRLDFEHSGEVIFTMTDGSTQVINKTPENTNIVIVNLYEQINETLLSKPNSSRLI